MKRYDNDWAVINYDGQEAYVSSRYIEKVEPVASAEGETAATVVRKRKRICAESNVNTAEKESPCLRQQSVKISRISREFMETVF